MTEKTTIHRENIVKSWLEGGLEEWEKSGASVEYIGQPPHTLPIVYAPAMSGNGKPKNVLIITGMHDEEISGPKVALTPKVYKQWQTRGYNFFIFPVVNLYGLQFPEDTVNDKLLRYDPQGKNYNDGWGNCSPSYKPQEVAIVEAAIKKISATHPIDLAISLHEDSENPNVGYLSTQNTNDQYIEHIYKHLKTSSSGNLIASFNSRTNPFGNGVVKNGCIIADDYDPRAFENWAAAEFRIPSILIEAPFGKDLKTKTTFQQDAFDSILSSFQNGQTV